MGYVVMKVQIEGVPSYGEDQVFLVVDDNSAGPSDTRYTHHQSRPQLHITGNYEFANGFFMGMVGAEAKGGAIQLSIQCNLVKGLLIHVPTFGTLQG